jgi:hypothetical protein
MIIGEVLICDWRGHGEIDRQQYSVSSGGSCSGGLRQFEGGIARPEEKTILHMGEA